MLVVASLCATLGIANAAPSVAVDLSHLDSSAVPDAAALEQALVMRLLQEGFAIDPLTAQPAIVVAISGGDRELVLSAKSAHFERSRTIEISGSSTAQLQLEVVQKLVELARLAREAAPPPALEVRPQADTTTTLRAAVVTERPPRWNLGVDVGVIASAVEGSLHARYAIAYGLGAAVRADVAQPDAAGIAVGEQELLAGASYEWPIADLFALDIALLGGVRRHHFELTMDVGEMTGTRFDAVLALPVRVSLRRWRVFELSLWGLAKLGKEREHVSGTAQLWHRDAVTAGLGAGVAARF